MAIRFTCGHCSVSSIGKVKGNVIHSESGINWYPFCLLQCDNCLRGTLISFHINSGWSREFEGFEKDHVVVDYANLHASRQYPIKQTKIPLYLPELLRNEYEDAEFNFHAKRWKPAAQIYLQCLEHGIILAATDGDEDEALISSSQRIDLTKRINSLFESGKITGAMKEWAHQIRVIGQYHKHRYVEASQDDCEAIRSYVELFLTYLFSLPGMINERKSKIG